MRDYFIFFGINVSSILMFNSELFLRKLNKNIYPGISRRNFVNYILAFVGGKFFKISMKIGVNVSRTSVSKENSEYT